VWRVRIKHAASLFILIIISVGVITTTLLTRVTFACMDFCYFCDKSGQYESEVENTANQRQKMINSEQKWRGKTGARIRPLPLPIFCRFLNAGGSMNV
jgi:hypothetical protein